MSRIHVLRHASTAQSRQYQVNGDPRSAVALDAGGRADCRDLAGRLDWLVGVRTCVVSGFARTGQTARLLLDRRVAITVDRRLDEVDYGDFEGGLWLRYGEWLTRHGRDAVPPGGRESLRDAQTRALSALVACAGRPGPCLVVAHGFLVSLLRRLIDHGDPGGLHLPGCPPLSVVSDEQMAAVAETGLTALTRAGAGDRPD